MVLPRTKALRHLPFQPSRIKSLALMPSSSRLVGLCQEANIPIPPTLAAMRKFLDLHGASIGPNNTKAALLDRCAALAWLQHAIANGLPTSSWPSILDDASSTVVLSLYPLPSASSSSGGQSLPDFERLARVVSPMSWLRTLLHNPSRAPRLHPWASTPSASSPRRSTLSPPRAPSLLPRLQRPPPRPATPHRFPSSASS